MSVVTHQTIKLAKGKHPSAEEGACVMELASMLAGEPVSDHPTSVCPVIGSCLRAYNDWIDDDRRQDLYAYAAKVVGTRAPPEVQRARGERVTAWAGVIKRRRSARWLLIRGRCALILSPQPTGMGRRVIQAVAQQRAMAHGEGLALIDGLVAIGPTRRPSSSPAVTLAIVSHSRA